MAGPSRWTAGQRVSTTSTAAIPPKRIASTPATAWTLIIRSAASWTRRPVWAQVRNVAVPFIEAPPLLHDDLAHHLVVPDPAELVADGVDLALLGRGDREDVLVSRKDHEVEVQREERESVDQVERGQVEAVGLP